MIKRNKVVAKIVGGVNLYNYYPSNSEGAIKLPTKDKSIYLFHRVVPPIKLYDPLKYYVVAT